MNTDIIAKSKIFKDFNGDEITEILSNIKHHTSKFKTDNIIYYEGETLDNFVIILKGKVKVLHCDNLGNQSLMNILGQSDTINENVVFTKLRKIPFRIVASEDTELLFLNFNSIMNIDNKDFKSRILLNLLNASAEKNILLTEKIKILSQRTIRQKIITYLNMLSNISNKKEITLPFNREEMATFLSVDRSALSAELSKLQKEGIIEFKKNKFTLK